jgi:hypothetical protein
MSVLVRGANVTGITIIATTKIPSDAGDGVEMVVDFLKIKSMVVAISRILDGHTPHNG